MGWGGVWYHGFIRSHHSEVRIQIIIVGIVREGLLHLMGHALKD